MSKPLKTIHGGDCRDVLVDLNPEYLRQQLRRANALPMGL